MQFFLVYITEAHSNQLGALGCNEKKPETLHEKAAVARKCLKDLNLTLPVLLSDTEGTVEKAYGPWPSRVCIVDKAGKILYAPPAAPQGINISAIEQELKKLP